MSCLIDWRGPGRWTVDFEVSDRSGALLLPDPVAPCRADALWKTTCFELFLRRAGQARYFEFNLSPSRQWAAYAFDDYRQGMSELDVAAPRIEVPVRTDGTFRLRASLETDLGDRGPWLAGLTAVIEEAGGPKSYWALAHGSDKPDFHHPDSFVLELA